MEAARIGSLYIVTGASGTGKTAIIPYLRKLLPEWCVFETDVLWDSGHDWDFVWSNWLRVAYALAQSGKRTILSGTVVPARIDACDHRRFFGRVHYAALSCSDGELVHRLQSRPAWRGCTEPFIQDQRAFARWLLDNAITAFDPPLTCIDAEKQTVESTAKKVAQWASSTA